MKGLVESIGIRRRPANAMGCRRSPAEEISCRGARPSRWVAGGVRRTRWVVGGIRRIPGNKHQDAELVREKVKGWSMAAGCGEIYDGIPRERAKKGTIWAGTGRTPVREGNSVRNPEGAQYHRRKPGGGAGCRAC